MTDDAWRPSASLATLQRRAAILATVRAFFADRGVLEVETPQLAPYSVTDPHMPVITADNPTGGHARHYLQTSPEYAMKRLLAAGSGPIFEIARAFRAGERSRRHNPEFTLLEWYRPGFSLPDLIDEVDALLQQVLGTPRAQRLSYRQLFQEQTGIDPMTADLDTIRDTARYYVDVQMHSDLADDWLHLLMAEVIEPALRDRGPVVVYNYPATQAALARIEPDTDGTPVARRFECYVDGLELANGYHELTDPEEQRRRFEADRQQRRIAGADDREPDPYLLAALEHSLPDCSGVALGLDRLVMLAEGCGDIAQVQAFACAPE